MLKSGREHVSEHGSFLSAEFPSCLSLSLSLSLDCRYEVGKMAVPTSADGCWSKERRARAARVVGNTDEPGP
jgi:hypothetical protein